VLVRTKHIKPKTSKQEQSKLLLENPLYIVRILNNRSFYNFFQYFWSEISTDELVLNWHMEFICNELQHVAERVGANQKKEHDLVINIPPGTSKTSIAMKMFPVWCWTKWHWMRFITSSYSQVLSLESGEASRDLIRSDKFKSVYPELEIKADKDVKSNYKIVKNKIVSKGHLPKQILGGNRYSTSVGGSVTGFHGHILIVDDPLNPYEAVSAKALATTNHWMDEVLSTRKVDKEVTPTILIMQRLHQNDPTGHLIGKNKKNVKHISLPGTLDGYMDNLKPEYLKQYYKDNLLDPKRLSKEVLFELEQDLGQYGFAGQIGQNPTPPGGGMFKVDKFSIIDRMPMEHEIAEIVRYWDKAGSAGKGAFTCGVKIAKLKNGKFIVVDVKRGQWATEERESIIKAVAESDGKEVKIYTEQEPGSGGKESAEATVRNLSGFVVNRDLPRGDKVYRADPYSVQVNYGNVALLYGAWNAAYIEELRFFPFGTYKDQVDASSGAFSKLTAKKIAHANY